MLADKPRGTVYIGVTSELHDRVWEHRNGINSKFTSRYRVQNLVWFERHPNIVLAIQREKSLKRYKREWKVKLIEEFNPSWMDLFERIDEMDNEFQPHSNTRMWEHYN